MVCLTQHKKYIQQNRDKGKRSYEQQLKVFQFWQGFCQRDKLKMELCDSLARNKPKKKV